MDKKPRLALSSCWCSHRHSDGYEMLQEMADLGFEYAELSHGIKVVLVEGILRAVEEGIIKISSVHNFCPLPTHINYAAPNLYEPTDQNPQMRQLWFQYTKRTIDFAKQVGADRMIVHSGSIPYPFKFFRPDNAISKYRDSHSLESLEMDPKYNQIVEKALLKLKNKQAKYIATLIDSYLRILPYAVENEVKMCIENRESLIELPQDNEMAFFLSQFPEPEWIGYWHDVGHAQIKQQEGIITQEQLLTENSNRHFGFHLHDVSATGRDHQPVGSGTIDFDLVKKFFKPEHTLVLEMSPRLETEEIVSSRDAVIKLLED